MRRMRERFGSLFAGKHESSSPKEPPPSKKKRSGFSPSRRRFIKEGSAAAAGLAVAVNIPEAEGAEVGRIRRIEREDDPEYLKLLNEVQAFMDSFNGEPDPSTGEREPKPISVRGMDKAHDMFVEKFGERIKKGLEQAFTEEDVKTKKSLPARVRIIRKDRQTLYAAMKQFNALGIYYAYISQAQENPDRDEFEKRVGWKDDKFHVRTSDYIPFEQGYAYPHRDRREAIDIRNRGSKDTDLQQLKEDPGLNQKEHYFAFCEMVHDDEIRDLFEKEDTSIAEMYSILKAVIKKQEAEDAPVLTLVEHEGNFRDYKFTDKKRTVELVKEMLKYRKRMKRVVFVGKDTKHLIGFSHAVEKGDSFNKTMPLLEKIAKRKGDPDVVHLQPQNTRDAAETEGNKALLRFNIQESSGETLILLETHGLKQRAKVGADTSYTVEELAEDLVKRIQKQKDGKTLGSVRIINDSCYSTDFSANLTIKINERLDALQISKKDIRLPTIVTTAQTSSLARADIFSEALKKYGHIIRREGKITGELLMRYIQPELYRYEDMAFFMDTLRKHGLIEIGDADNDNREESIAA